MCWPKTLQLESPHSRQQHDGILFESSKLQVSIKLDKNRQKHIAITTLIARDPESLDILLKTRAVEIFSQKGHTALKKGTGYVGANYPCPKRLGAFDDIVWKGIL